MKQKTDLESQRRFKMP